MILIILFFLLLGLAVGITPGAILGYFFVAVSSRLPRGVRILSLLVLAAVSATTWLFVPGVDHIWRAPLVVLSFAATLASGATFLGREASRRRASRLSAVGWPG
ncbi:hypothetical protein ACFWBF_26825 [Streptomyces sp. NPDC060028]|uniref:hypothetical protein n=1 Tax=Streptomyces sp. NPDC060028 TaxID=3347041 RepID=UPI003684A4D4